MTEQMRFCKMCTHPNTRPRITFNEDGVCNGCQRTMEKKEEIDWDAKEQELVDRIKAACDAMPDRQYDVIVPVSGGKDSTFQAWWASVKHGFKTLCVNNQPFLPTEVGMNNLRNMSEQLPIDMISIVPNQKVYAEISRKNLELHGDPLAQNIYLLFSGVSRFAFEKRVPIILFGENGDKEYGGSSDSKFNEITNEGVTARIQSDKPKFLTPPEWTEWGIDARDLSPYIEPSDEEFEKANIHRVFMSDYLPWNNNYHLHVALNVVGGFEMREERSPGTYTFGYSTDNDLFDLYLWMLYPKFGFCRSTKYTSKDIQEGKIDRDRAIELVRDYDGEFPWRAAERYMAKTGMSEDEFWDVVARFVGDEENLRQEAETFGTPMKIPAWERLGPKKWRLRATIYEDERILELPLERPKSNVSMPLNHKIFP